MAQSTTALPSSRLCRGAVAYPVLAITMRCGYPRRRFLGLRLPAAPWRGRANLPNSDCQLLGGQFKKPLKKSAVTGVARPPLHLFPGLPGGFVHRIPPGGFGNRPSQRAAFPAKLPADRVRLGLRVVAKIGNDPRHGLDRNSLRPPQFPVHYGAFVHAKPDRQLFAGKPVLQPLLKHMLADRARRSGWLDLSSVNNQDLTCVRHVWQKSNAKMPLRAPGVASQELPLHARPGRALPGQAERAVAGPDRPAR